jgi:hypothetical protein
MTTPENTTTANLVVILDTVGRTILGEQVATTDTTTSIKNPVILHIVPAGQDGRMQVQLLPLFFREFLGDKTSDVTFTYNNSQIVSSDIDAIDFRLQGQYSQIFNPNNQFVTGGVPAGEAGAGNDNVVKLFDE